VGPR